MNKKKILIIIGLIVALVAGFLIYGFVTGGNDGTSLNPIVKDPNAEQATDETLLILVNKNNKLPDDYHADLVKLDDVMVSKIIINDLVDLRDAATREGISLSINSAYRSAEEQERLYNATADKSMVSQPGYSEHETGLAIDFAIGSGDGNMATWMWLGKNAHKYGFIQRYPENMVRVTGISWEPWHYRYVGKKHAKAIHDQGLTLEEYVGAEDVRPHGDRRPS